MEHPFGGSWGYQPLGLFAPTAASGRRRISPISSTAATRAASASSWTGCRRISDRRLGLAQFDGTPLYEHADPREGFHQDWNTLIFNLGRNEVKGFMIASAFEWLDRYHVDALRVDAVASMLYRDYSRKAASGCRTSMAAARTSSRSSSSNI